MRRQLLVVVAGVLLGSLVLGSLAAALTTSAEAAHTADRVFVSALGDAALGSTHTPPAPRSLSQGAGGVTGSPPPPSGAAVFSPQPLSQADATALATALSGVTATGRSVARTVTVAGGDQRLVTGLAAVDPAYPLIAGWQLTDGRWFDQTDAAAAAPVALLSADLAARLFPGDSPVGQAVAIRDLPFTVVGVLAGGASPASTVVVPFATGQVRLFGVQPLDQIALQVADPSQTPAIAAQAEQDLRQRHELLPGQPDDFLLTVGQPTAQLSARDPLLLELAGRVLDGIQWYACHAKARCP